MLLSNNSYLNSIRTFSAREGVDALFNKRNGLLIANAYFGTNTSFPQGYNNQYAIIMPLNNSYNISVIIRGVGNVLSDAIIREEGNSTIIGEGTVIALCVTKESDGSTMQGVGTFNSSSQVEESLSAIIDAGSRPSSLDIAQEVIESKIEGNYSLKDLIQIMSAILAGKTTTIGTSQEASITFRNISDTINIVEASVSPTSRNIISINN